nr:integrase, catalytic region, zinc finger, CCHC-type, peptidase aspartic, catalytic [Tanacetum cinerariifolium]
MILESIENGLLIWPTIEENAVTRPKKYSELSAMEAIKADCDVKATNIIFYELPPEERESTEAIQADCDVKATNIILQGLPPEVYALERECKLYDEFDKFAYKKGKHYNTKFLNTLPPEWSKFVTDVKIVQELHTTNIDQLHAYLEQHEFLTNEVRLMHERNSDMLALVATHQRTQVYYVEGLGHNLFSVGQFCDSNMEVAFRQHTCYIRNLEDLGIPERQAIHTVITHNVAYQADDLDEYDSNCDKLNTAEVALMVNLSHYGSDALTENSNLSAQQDALILSVIKQLKTQVVNCTKINLENKSVNDTLTAELERYKEQVKVLKEGQIVEVGISHETFVARSSQKNGVVKRRNRTLIEAARTISSGLALHEMTPATLSLGLVPNPPHSTPFIPSS